MCNTLIDKLLCMRFVLSCGLEFALSTEVLDNQNGGAAIHGGAEIGVARDVGPVVEVVTADLG